MHVTKLVNYQLEEEEEKELQQGKIHDDSYTV
jgi:hypothetical protein